MRISPYWLLVIFLFSDTLKAQWVNVGSTGLSNGTAVNIAVAIDNNDTPYIVFADDANGSKANVMKFTGGNWVSVGASDFSHDVALPISMALDAGGTPYVAFGDTSHKATVMKYNGSSWTTVGQADFSDSGLHPTPLS